MYIMSLNVHGIQFPFRIDPKTGGVATASGQEKIRQNMRVVLGTRTGERPMLRDYGTRIHSLVHNPNDNVTAELIRQQAQEALLRWEPRVLVTGAQVVQEEGELRLQLNYVYTHAPIAEQMIVPLR